MRLDLPDTHSKITCANSTTEKLEKNVKYVQS